MEELSINEVNKIKELANKRINETFKSNNWRRSYELSAGDVVEVVTAYLEIKEVS